MSSLGSTAAPTAFATRRAFLDFFAANGHTVVRSSPLVPSDPTLLFTNAGMVQFKDVFTGQKQLEYRRAATAQKCVRAGGKHNDLDNVGRTARHHTFFEMLGNFSFGDYFKEAAIDFAWQLLHKEMGLPKDRLMFTVFCGEDGIPADDEARSLWQRITGVSGDRILGLGKKDNFWMMGDTGPQGPCSEIHFHQGDDLPCEEVQAGRHCLGPACDCDRWLEIWNLVFMQFERRQKDGPLLALPAPSIDTGAGLERLTAVLQGKRSNYDTDLFTPLIATVAEAAKRKYAHSDSDDDVGMRVLADHSRATCALISDGVLPSNLGRGYVLRSIMRRAIRFAVRLDLPAGFFVRLCLQVSDMLGEIYPEMQKARSLVEKAVNAEDEGFRATIHRGLRLIAETKDWQKSATEKRVLPGQVAFALHDTYGFPLDLTQVIGREQGFLVDELGFAEEMKKQRERSKFTGSGDAAVAAAYHTVRSASGPTQFLGYDVASGNHAQGRVVALFVHGESVGRADVEQEVEVVIDKTPFYGRSGGQVGDTGQIRSEAGELHVSDTIKPLADLTVHRAQVKSGSIAVGDAVDTRVDAERRNRTRKNHSATHLLHHALRAVLGEHVTQKGSYVGPDKLTFDFSHFAPLSVHELRQVERRVNAAIRENAAAIDEETSYDEAQKRGAMALFGEKYGDRVRMMHIGASIELCGGTHVGRSGDIGLFKIVSETGIAKGIRRIEALTAEAAETLWEAQEAELTRAGELLRASPMEVAERVARLLEELKARERELLAQKKKLAQASSSDLYFEERTVLDLKVVARRVEIGDPKALREVAETLRDQSGADLVILGGVADGKVTLVAAAKKALADAGRVHAGKLVGALATKVGGKGGGRADVAQAGGSEPDKLDAALRESFALLAANGGS